MIFTNLFNRLIAFVAMHLYRFNCTASFATVSSHHATGIRIYSAVALEKLYTRKKYPFNSSIRFLIKLPGLSVLTSFAKVTRTGVISSLLITKSSTFEIPFCREN